MADQNQSAMGIYRKEVAGYTSPFRFQSAALGIGGQLTVVACCFLICARSCQSPPQYLASSRLSGPASEASTGAEKESNAATPEPYQIDTHTAASALHCSPPALSNTLLHGNTTPAPHPRHDLDLEDTIPSSTRLSITPLHHPTSRPSAVDCFATRIIPWRLM